MIRFNTSVGMHTSKRQHNRSSVRYQDFQNSQVDALGNASLQTIKVSVSNIPTKAYAKFTKGQIQQKQTNFVNDYYLENISTLTKQSNTVVKDYEEAILPDSAYSMAEHAKSDYEAFRLQRQLHLLNARARARRNSQAHFSQKTQKKKERIQSNMKWITNLVRRVEQLISHIGAKSKMEDAKANKFQRDSTLASQLAGIKVTDPGAVIKVLECTKGMLLRKVAAFEEQRQEQEHNVSASATEVSQDISSASFASAATCTTVATEDHLQKASKYCDFEVLGLKWGADNVDIVKQLLKRLLTNTIICKGEGEIARSRGKNKSYMQKPFKEVSKKVEWEPFSLGVSLTKEQQTAKNQLMRGGIYDSVGQIYQRNRNYSQIFACKRRQTSSRWILHAETFSPEKKAN